MKKAPQPDEADSFGPTHFKLLDLIGDVTNEDIGELGDKISDKYRDVFDEAKEDEKLIYAALCKMSDEELKDIYARPHKMFPGIHNIRDHLAVLFIILPGFVERCSTEE